MERLSRGGIYLARLDPAKGAEIGKLRSVAGLLADDLLEMNPLVVFVCPLSSRSDPAFSALHVELPPRDRLKVSSFALVEHYRGISRRRKLSGHIAKLLEIELAAIFHRLQRLIGLYVGRNGVQHARGPSHCDYRSMSLVWTAAGWSFWEIARECPRSRLLFFPNFPRSS